MKRAINRRHYLSTKIKIYYITNKVFNCVPCKRKYVNKKKRQILYIPWLYEPDLFDSLIKSMFRNLKLGTLLFSGSIVLQ